MYPFWFPNTTQKPQAPVKTPTRSMSHSVHTGTKVRRVKVGEPFDADELSRRLTTYLTEQKLASIRRREVRAAKERLLAAENYHHVPTVAAAAFERTATPIIVTEATVHKLAAPVLKALNQGPNQGDENACENGRFGRKSSTRQRPTTALKATIAHDQAEVARERIRNRNQFQRTRDLEEAAGIDELRDVYRLPQRTFGEFAHLRNVKALSAGDVFSDTPDVEEGEKGALAIARKKSTRKGAGFEGRSDWAQEEVKIPKSPLGKAPEGRATVKERVMKRKASVWVLMGKKEKAGPAVGSADEGSSSPPPLPMDGKRGFLARFRKQTG